MSISQIINSSGNLSIPLDPSTSFIPQISAPALQVGFTVNPNAYTSINTITLPTAGSYAVYGSVTFQLSATGASACSAGISTSATSLSAITNFEVPVTSSLVIGGNLPTYLIDADAGQVMNLVCFVTEGGGAGVNASVNGVLYYVKYSD